MYYVYMLRCKDNSIYTGITTDINRRLEEHKTKDKKCAKYTRTHDVVKLETAWVTNDKQKASKLEYYIKRLKKEEKEKIIKSKELNILENKIDIKEYRSFKEY